MSQSYNPPVLCMQDSATKRSSVEQKYDKMSQSFQSQMSKGPMKKCPMRRGIPNAIRLAMQDVFVTKCPFSNISHVTCISQPVGYRIHGTYPPVEGSKSLASSLGSRIHGSYIVHTRHLSQGPLVSSIHTTYLPAHWVVGSMAPIFWPIG
jgi:hypothetical protein